MGARRGNEKEISPLGGIKMENRTCIYPDRIKTIIEALPSYERGTLTTHDEISEDISAYCEKKAKERPKWAIEYQFVANMVTFGLYADLGDFDPLLAFSEACIVLQGIADGLNTGEVVDMKNKERDALNGALAAVEDLNAAYKDTDWSRSMKHFSAVLDAVLEVAHVFIPESKAGEVIDMLRKTCEDGKDQKQSVRGLKYRVNNK